MQKYWHILCRLDWKDTGELKKTLEKGERKKKAWQKSVELVLNKKLLSEDSSVKISEWELFNLEK